MEGLDRKYSSQAFLSYKPDLKIWMALKKFVFNPSPKTAEIPAKFKKKGLQDSGRVRSTSHGAWMFNGVCGRWFLEPKCSCKLVAGRVRCWQGFRIFWPQISTLTPSKTNLATLITQSRLQYAVKSQKSFLMKPPGKHTLVASHDHHKQCKW